MENSSNNIIRGMPSGMETEVPDRTSSSSNNKSKPKTRRKSIGGRSLTPKNPKKKQKNQQQQQKIKSKKKKLSLNSSWSSKRSKSSNRSYKSAGTMYTNLSQNNKPNQQKPKVCRYWRQNKCGREHCEFAHYQIKHLNTTYNDCMQEGAKAINEFYHNSLLNKMALVQVTSLQYMMFEEIENRMKNTLSYKEEIQIAITNKKSFQRSKKEYQKSCKALIDDSFKNKIQLKIDVLQKYYEEINKKKLPQKINNTQYPNSESEINQIPQNQTSPILIEQQKGKTMENEQQKHTQQVTPLINNYTVQEIEQNIKTNKKKREKEKKEDNKYPFSRQNINQDTNTSKQVERRKSISKKMESTSMKTKKPNENTPHPIFENIQLKHSKNHQNFQPSIIDRANGLTGIISQYHINDLAKIASDTAKNNGQLPEAAQQRLFPPLMQPNNLYPQYLISQITNKQNEINEIGENLKVSNEIKEKIKVKITVDAAALYLFKTPMLYTTREDLIDQMLNNVSLLATQKIKNVMRDSLQINIPQVNYLGIRYILEYPFATKDRINYYQDFIFNIGTPENEIMVAVEVKDVKSQTIKLKK